MAVLEGLNRDERITVIVVTHEADIAAYTSREVIIKDGQIVTDRAKTRETLKVIR
jgi:putative ABC transport system ATP-binding protein